MPVGYRAVCDLHESAKLHGTGGWIAYLRGAGHGRGEQYRSVAGEFYLGDRPDGTEYDDHVRAAVADQSDQRDFHLRV